MRPAAAARPTGEIGVRNLEDVERTGLDLIATLHGVGPKAARLLRADLEK
jgi:hypothetical protein